MPRADELAASSERNSVGGGLGSKLFPFPKGYPLLGVNVESHCLLVGACTAETTRGSFSQTPTVLTLGAASGSSASGM